MAKMNLCPVCDTERSSDLKMDGVGNILGCCCDFSFDATVAIAKAWNEGRIFDTNELIGTMLSSPLLHPYFLLKSELKGDDEKFYNKTYNELVRG